MKKYLIIALVFLLITGCKEKINIKGTDMSEKILITINNEKYELKLANNDTSEAFIKLLPKELEMTELNGNEKYTYLDEKLPVNEYSPKTIEKGDVMLYQNNCLVIFYKSFNTNYKYSKIGHIDNLMDLGNENIIVKIEN